MIIDHSLGCAECGGACRGLGSCYDDYLSKHIDLSVPANANLFRACQAAEVANNTVYSSPCPPGFHQDLAGIVDYALSGLGICVEDKIYGPVDRHDGKGLVQVTLTEFKSWQIAETAYQENLQKQQYAELMQRQEFANNQAALQAQQAQAQRAALAMAAQQAEVARLDEIARQQALAKSNATAAAQQAAQQAASAEAARTAALIASQNAVVQAAQVAAAKAAQDAREAEAAKQAKIARETCPAGFHWEETGISGLGVLSACIADAKMPNNQHPLNEKITETTQPAINWLKTEGIISGVPNWVLLGVGVVGVVGLAMGKDN